MDTTLTTDTSTKASTSDSATTDTLDVPGRWTPADGSVLEHYDITTGELDQLLIDNPSLRSFVVGYSAEAKLNAAIQAAASDGVRLLGKPDDHDRTSKADQYVTYKGYVARIEVKSLQSATVKPDSDGTLVGHFQCDASDCREVTLPDASTLKTTCLAVGGFDVLAVNCFEFFGEWRFAFAAQDQLPRTTCTRYTEYQRKHLLATTPVISSDLDEPFSWSLVEVLDALIEAGDLPLCEEVP